MPSGNKRPRQTTTLPQATLTFPLPVEYPMTEWDPGKDFGDKLWGSPALIEQLFLNDDVKVLLYRAKASLEEARARWPHLVRNLIEAQAYPQANAES